MREKIEGWDRWKNCDEEEGKKKGREGEGQAQILVKRFFEKETGFSQVTFGYQIKLESKNYKYNLRRGKTRN